MTAMKRFLIIAAIFLAWASAWAGSVTVVVGQPAVVATDPHYSQKVTITGASGAGSNYQVPLTIEAGAGDNAAGVMYCNGHTSSFPSDIRVTSDSAGTTTLPFWISTVDGDADTKKIWVRHSADLSSGTADFYVWYGNTTSISNSASGANTFNFYDDFEGLSSGGLNGQNSWTAHADFIRSSTYKEGSYGVSADSSESNTTAYHAVTAGNTRKQFIYYIRDNFTARGGGEDYAGSVYANEGANIVTGVSFSNGSSARYWNHLKSAAWEHFDSAPSADTWYKISLDFPSTSTHRVLVDDSNQSLTANTNFTNISTNTDRVTLSTGSVGQLNITIYDLIIVREFVNPEPSVGTPGAEVSH